MKEQAKKREAPAALRCACGGEPSSFGTKQLVEGPLSLTGRGLGSVLRGEPNLTNLNVEVYACGKCGKIEMYA